MKRGERSRFFLAQLFRRRVPRDSEGEQVVEKAVANLDVPPVNGVLPNCGGHRNLFHSGAETVSMLSWVPMSDYMWMLSQA